MFQLYASTQFQLLINDKNDQIKINVETVTPSMMKKVTVSDFRQHSIHLRISTFDIQICMMSQPSKEEKKANEHQCGKNDVKATKLNNVFVMLFFFNLQMHFV